MNKIEIVHYLPEKDWRSFSENNPNSNVFHTPEMFEVFARTKGYRPKLWAAVDTDGLPLALLLPVQISLFDGWLRELTTRAVVFGGVLWSPNDNGLRAVTLLLQSYTQSPDETPLFTELRNLSEQVEIQPALRESEFLYEDHLNYLIDLNRPPESIFEGFKPRTRKDIRHVIHEGQVTVEELKQIDQIKPWYEILRKTYQAARVPLVDISLFQAAAEILGPNGMIRFTQACAARAIVAISVELLYKDTIFGWYGGLDRAYSSFRANDFLMWQILEWGSRNGFREYDFGGAGKPSEKYGVRDFKAKFGGRLVCYGRNTYSHKPKLLSISQRGYKLFRGFL